MNIHLKVLVLFIYLQIVHQSNQHQHDSSVLLSKLLRNRRQSDPTRIIFCDEDYEDCNNSQRNQGNFITDSLVTSTTNQPATNTVAVPGMGTTPTACERTCRTTPEYNPVCGDDNVTYRNINRFKCTQQCGKSK